MTIVQFLREFPAMFGVMGLLAGVICTFLINKKFGPMQSDAFNKVIEAQSKLSEIQGEQHMQTLQMQKDHWAEELAKLENERNNYRTELHAERETHNACKLKIQELEMRPTVEVIQSEQHDFFTKLLDRMEAIGEKVTDHEAKVPQRMSDFQKPILKACSEISTGMQALVETLRDCGTLPRSRKNRVKTTSISENV